MVDEKATDEPTTTPTDVRSYLLDCGACCVGFADVSDLPGPAQRGLHRAICIGLPLRPEPIARLRQRGQRPVTADAPTLAALLELARIAIEYLEQCGARGELLDPATVGIGLTDEDAAVRSGVAWIGRSSRPVTWEFGSAIRLVTVLTDADLPADAPTVRSFCGSCLMCTEACEAHAPSGIIWEPGMAPEDFVDVDACLARRRELAKEGMDCRYCMSVCPFTMVYLGLCGIEPDGDAP